MCIASSALLGEATTSIAHRGGEEQASWPNWGSMKSQKTASHPEAAGGHRGERADGGK